MKIALNNLQEESLKEEDMMMVEDILIKEAGQRVMTGTDLRGIDMARGLTLEVIHIEEIIEIIEEIIEWIHELNPDFLKVTSSHLFYCYKPRFPEGNFLSFVLLLQTQIS